MFDTHTHTNFVAYKEDSKETIERALDSGVKQIVVGSQLSTSERGVEQAEKFDGVYSAIALHPIHIKERKIFEEVGDGEKVEFLSRAEEFEYEKYLKLAKSSKKVVAIGETGLDYYHLHDEDKEGQIAKQKEVFKMHIKLANELGLPMIIHCREAYDELMDILKENMPEKGGVIHSFQGTPEQAKLFVEMGFYLGINGVLTFKNVKPEQLQVVDQTELEKLITETDCPYLTPVPHRGKRNEPAYVKYVVEKIAELKGVSAEEVEKVTDNNAKKLFNI